MYNIKVYTDCSCPLDIYSGLPGSSLSQAVSALSAIFLNEIFFKYIKIYPPNISIIYKYTHWLLLSFWHLPGSFLSKAAILMDYISTKKNIKDIYKIYVYNVYQICLQFVFTKYTWKIYKYIYKAFIKHIFKLYPQNISSSAVCSVPTDWVMASY